MKPSLVKWLGLMLALVVAVPFLDTDPISAQAPPPRPPQGPPSQFVAGEILVKFKPGTPAQVVADAHRQNQGQVQDVIPEIDVQVVRIPPGQEQARVAAYERHPNVEFAELHGFYYATQDPPPPQWHPNDPGYPQQWQYHNTGQTAGTIDADIDAPEAWETPRGSGAAPIAILDTGISRHSDFDRPDLTSQVIRQQNFTRSPTLEDRYGHGTHVAGSAAAVTNNGAGVAGACPECPLYNVKVLGDDGAGSWGNIAKGINWATDNGAKVINMSLSGSAGSRTVESAVNRAWSRGAVLVAAAGNSGQGSAEYPALYAHVIAVAATDHNDVRPGFSNWGYGVDLAAPGVNILSTMNNGGYLPLHGTSMATPHVAGVAGLVWSSGRCASNQCVRDRLFQRADQIFGTLHRDGQEPIYQYPYNQWHYGRVNAHRSVAP